ncbi:hypothetical protein [Dyadobacter luticola]|uniref:Uncharacterized protein n=1 Tax=Dyadobacter luticola TaxID=1979387 RepID=A0A5R9KRV0_9BACT|nr:hypothetical protein [Dyadobacter luticola]TLU99011.1 hypothetical protein FEN17_20735 [Dyadobacter luticola]
MKNAFLAVLSALLCIACNPGSDDQPERKDGLIPITKASETNLFPTLPGYESRKEMEAIRKNGDLTLLFRSENELYQKVQEIFDFTIHPKNEGIEIERKKAQAGYRKFIETYKDERIMLSQFRNQYAKRLLLDYKIMNSDRYQDLQFYTNELIESHLGNYDLILKCLSKLEGNIDKEQFAKLVQDTHLQMNESVENEKLLKVAIADMIRQKEAEAREEQKLIENGGTGNKPRKKLMLSLLKHNQQNDRSKLLEGYLTVIKKFEDSLSVSKV